MFLIAAKAMQYFNNLINFRYNAPIQKVNMEVVVSS